MIIACTCTHVVQDELHGNRQRVHNPCKHDTKARCTVCGSEKELTPQQTKAMKETE